MNEKEKLNAVYVERNKILSALAWTLSRRGLHHTTVGIALHPDCDENWEKDWRNMLVIQVGADQMTWHFHDSEMHLFKGLPFIHDYKWDGHTTEEKYNRLINCLA